MKQEYTQYKSITKELFKDKLNKDIKVSLREFIDGLISILDDDIKQSYNTKDIITKHIFRAEYDYFFNKHIYQYFIPSIDLINFMINSFKTNIDYNDLLNLLLIGKNDINTYFIINFPVKSDFKSVLFAIDHYFDEKEKSDKKLITYSISKTIDKYQTRGSLNTDNFKLIMDEKNIKEYNTKFVENKTHNVIPYLKLLIGMCLYRRCFPQSVRDGLPEDCSHPNHYKNGKTINIVDELIEATNSDRNITPHIRCGHFRLLKNERYINKRYQVIFIKECFVNGKAKTIEDVNNRKLIQEVDNENR
jgi:hypothetical protein